MSAATALDRKLFYDCLAAVRMLLAVLLGMCASLLLVILSAKLTASICASPVLFKFTIIAVSFPSVAVGVGASVGLVAKRWSGLAAAISLAPWVVWLIDTAERPEFAIWFKAILLTASGLYISMGIAAAVFTARRSWRSLVHITRLGKSRVSGVRGEVVSDRFHIYQERVHHACGLLPGSHGRNRQGVRKVHISVCQLHGSRGHEAGQERWLEPVGM
jgi:hypothetical protein